jgi:hypothetical protein
MRTIVSAYSLLALAAWAGMSLTAQAAPTPKDSPKPAKESSAEFIKKMLDAKTNLELSGMSLPTALAQIGDDHKINLVLDEGYIRQFLGMEPDQMMVNVKQKDVKLRNGLRTMLNQHNLTFAIVGDSVLVTTEEQAVYKQLKQRISVDVDNLPLNKALRDMAQHYAVNIVIDPRAMKNKGAEAPVTLTVDDVPFEAVVRLMCEMGGLKPARMGNVIFVTTEDRADKLKDSELVPNPGVPGGPGTIPGLPGGGAIPGGLLPGGGAVPVPPALPAVPAPAPALPPTVYDAPAPRTN